MHVDYNDNYTTIINLTVPGMWVEDVEENGIIYQKLELPKYSTTMDEGMPAIPCVGGFVGFHEISDTGITYTDNMTLTIENYNVYPFHRKESDNRIDSNKKLNNYYNLSNWYPEDRSSITNSMVMRDFPVTHFGIVPFEYNQEQKILIVHPEMTINVFHTPESKGDFRFKSTGEVDPIFVPMYQSLVLNYDDLGLPPTKIPLIEYLIVTYEEYYNQSNDFANYLRDNGYSVYVMPVPQYSLWTDLYDDIKEFYDNNHNRYVLLVGDIPKIPIGIVNVANSYYESDTVFSCLDIPFYNYNTDDFIPDVALGRLCVKSPIDAVNQFNKIIEHYTYRKLNPTTWLRVLFVSYYKKEYKDRKNKIFDLLNYTKIKPDKQFMDGFYYGNAQVIDYINSKQPMLVNYYGHGTELCWDTWTYHFPYSFRFQEIEQLNPGHLRPVVINIACDNAYIFCPESFSEHWMTVQGGAVGTIGATTESGTPDDYLDEYLFRCIYDECEPRLGIVQNWAKLNTIRISFLKDGSLDNALIIHFIYLLLGDPSLQVLPGISSNMVANTSTKISNISYSNIHVYMKTSSSIDIYPNPSYDIINIKLNNFDDKFTINIFDISGRLVYNKTYEDVKNEIVINPLDIGVRSGIYIIKIEGNKNIITK
ncbi:MAG: C25 family cysteine peptidase, partial [bacterium]